MPEAIERITLGSTQTTTYASEPHIAAHVFPSNASTLGSENVDGYSIFLATCSMQPQPVPAS